jgi:uncharacterized hydrophobic protein (TIGR00271 family)
MNVLARFKITDEELKTRAVDRLIKSSTPDFDFFLFVVLAVLMATVGLLLDSATVIIGSMLIAPILSPILSLSLALVMSDYRLLTRSLTTLGKAFAFGIGLSFLAAFFFEPGAVEIGQEVILRTTPSLLYFVVAVISGFAVSYALVQPDLNETFPGVAVSVSILPPIAVMGIGLKAANWSIVNGALALVIINVIGIVFASMICFSLLDLYRKKQVATKAIETEERRLEDEQEKLAKVAHDGVTSA